MKSMRNEMANLVLGALVATSQLAAAAGLVVPGSEETDSEAAVASGLAANIHQKVQAATVDWVV
jgi:hypothetical protein